MYYDEDVFEKYKNYRLITLSTAVSSLSEGIGLSKNVGTRKNVKSLYQRINERDAAIKREGENVITKLYEHASKMCPNINEVYVRESLDRCIAGDPNYEIIIVTRPSKRITHSRNRPFWEINYTDLNREKKLGKIRGFLIAQKGECKKYPLAYAVNLICTRESGIASLLIGAYMYAIRSNTVLTQKGLLELAGTFYNMNAYCLYRKMGFVVDPDIFDPSIIGTKCLSDDDGMLPMSVDLSDLSLMQILKMIASPSTNKEPLCDRRFTKEMKYSDESGAKLNTLRDRVYNLEMITYYFNRGFSRRRDYFRFFEYPITRYRLLLLLIDVVREIQADQKLMKSISMNTTLTHLKPMIGWGTIYNLNEEEKYKTEFIFLRDANKDADKDYIQLKSHIDSLHAFFPRYQKNILLETLKEKIDKTFQEYMEEYERLENGSQRKSVVLEEPVEKSPKNKTHKTHKTHKGYLDIPVELHPWSPRTRIVDVPKKIRTTVKSKSPEK
uniref:Uncharacterized protein n=1 Tax=viral metagenome TaxID=1070528 RepID=A0A6C0ATM8_9ZZZZ